MSSWGTGTGEGGELATPQPSPPLSPLLQKYLPYTSPPTGSKCRVFISHAGEQKHICVDFIREGLEANYPALKKQVFLDDKSLEGGQRDAIDEICSCLQDACVVIVFLSKDFISKRYPMEELQLLMHWQRQGSPLQVLPVLYDITYEEASQVAKYYKAMAAAGSEGKVAAPLQLSGRLSGVKCVADAVLWGGGSALLQQWAQCLLQVLSITGFRRDQAPWGTDMRDKVVEQTVKLLRDMGKMPTHSLQMLPSVTVGLHERAAQVVKQLREQAAQTPHRTMLLLHGMGGIGKTTLAREVFNELHKEDPTVPCCFVELAADINNVGRLKAMCVLLERLAQENSSELASVNEGLQCISQSLQGTKVLLVVDNVWDDRLDLVLPKNILDVVGEGSVVLVTSRDPGAVAKFGGEGRCVQSQAVDLLSDDAAMELMCKLAYQSATPPAEEEQEVQGVVRRCGGLPMAVQAVGLHLGQLKTANDRGGYFRDMEKAMRHSFGRQETERTEGERTLFAALELSWERLSEEGRNTLLDIVGGLVELPWGWLDAYSDFGVLQELLQYGLVSQVAHAKGDPKEQWKTRMAVHDTVAEFCTKAVQAGCTGLTVAKLPDVRSILEARTGNAEGMWLQGVVGSTRLEPDLATIHPQHQQLRHLAVGCAESSLSLGSDKGPAAVALRRLRLLEVERLAPTAAVLKLPGWTSQLRVLMLGELEGVRALHGLQQCGQLRVLSIRNAKQLTDVDLTGLDRLAYLGLSGCDALRHLDLTGVKALEHSRVHRCLLLEAVTVSGLARLETLRVQYCAAVSVVTGEGQLPRLWKLKVKHCCRLAAVNIPDAPGLEVLEVSQCESVREVRVGAAALLRSMCLEDNESLQVLQLGDGGQLRELQLRNLPCVRSMQLGGSDLMRAVGESALSKPQLFGLDLLKGLPGLNQLKLAELPQLQALDVHGLGALTQLKVLGCPQLQRLGASGVAAMVHLSLQACDCEQQLDVGGCTALEVLELIDCTGLQRLVGLGASSALKRVSIRDCGQLTAIQGLGAQQGFQHCNMEHPQQAQLGPGYEAGNEGASFAGARVEVDSCAALHVLSLRGMRAVRDLDVDSCGELCSLDLTGMGALEVLSLCRCDELSVMVGSEGLSCLRTLRVIGAQQLQALQLPKGGGAIEEVSLLSCQSLRFVEGVEGLEGLKWLSHGDSDDSEAALRPRDLMSLASGTLKRREGARRRVGALKRVVVHGCDAVHTVDLTGMCGVEKVVLSGCSSLCGIKGLEDIEALKELHIDSDNQLRVKDVHVQHISGLRALEALKIPVSWLVDMRSKHGLQLQALQSLTLTGRDDRALRGIQGLLVGLKNLRQLGVEACDGLWMDAEAMAALEQLPALEELVVTDCGQLPEITGLGRLKALREVEVMYCALLEVLEVKGSSSLQQLVVGGCEELRSVDVTGLPALQRVELQSCGSLGQVVGLSSLSSLTELRLWSTGITALELTGLGALQRVEVEKCDQLQVVDLRELPALGQVHLRDCPSVKVARLSALNSLQSVWVSHCHVLGTLRLSENLGTLHKVVIWHCDGLKEVDLRGLAGSLRFVSLDDCPALCKVPGLRKCRAAGVAVEMYNCKLAGGQVVNSRRPWQNPVVVAAAGAAAAAVAAVGGILLVRGARRARGERRTPQDI